MNVNGGWMKLVIIAVFSIAFAVRAAPVVHADDPPLGDCFGGVLSKDPLHCYVLEQAQRRDVIDIEAIYDVVDTYLYIFLRQDDPIGDGVGRFFREKSHEFADRWRDRVAEPPEYDYCVRAPVRLWPGVPVGGTRDCLVDATTIWTGDTLLPYSANYKNILVRAGGEEARHVEPADIRRPMRKVWPVTPRGASGASGSSSGVPTTFDVSEVDMTNLPVHACPEVLHGHRLEICSRDQDLAPSVVERQSGGWVVYYQIKDPPEDKAELAALKEILFPCYDRIGACTYRATTTISHIVNGVETQVATSTQVYLNSSKVTKLEVIPVKYNRGELRRWAEILDRFATSTGNTIGILAATVSNNHPRGSAEFWPLDTLGSAASVADIRTTIELSAHNGQRVVDSLSVLLPLLGIPTDAVGVVREWEAIYGVTPGARHPGPNLEDVEYSLEYYDRPVLDRYAARIGVSSIVLIGATGVGAALVVGGVVALGLRLRRRALG